MTQAVLDAFPRRPLKLVRSRGRRVGRLLLLLAALLLTLPSLYFGFLEYQERQLHADLRSHGVSGEVMGLEGDCYAGRSRLTNDRRARGCDLEISYRLRAQEGGEVRTADVRLEGEAPPFLPAAVYDPGDPSRVMLDWEVQREPSWSEWIGPLVPLVLPVMLVGLWIYLGQGGLAAAARRPLPEFVPIDRAARGRGQVDIFFTDPVQSRQFVETFHDDEPFLVSSSEGGVLGLALRGRRRPFLLDRNLLSLDLAEEERAAVFRATGAG